MRLLRNFLFFFVGFVIIAVPMLSFAESISATQITASQRYSLGGTALNVLGASYVPADNSSSSASAVCAAKTAGGLIQGGSYSLSGTTASFICGRWSGGSWISDGVSSAIYGPYYCGDVLSSAGATCLSCPVNQNWTLSGTTCARPDCVSPEVRQSDGSCFNNCVSFAGMKSDFWSGQTYCGKGAMVSSICAGGCLMDMTGGVGFGSPVTSWCQKIGKYTGAACTGGDSVAPAPEVVPDGKIADSGETLNPDSPEKKCIDNGQGFGSVNGVTVCVSASTSSGSSTTTTTLKNPDGTTGTPSTTGKTETSVKNSDGSTTTTTITTNADGSSSTSVVTTQGSLTGGGSGSGGNGTSADGVPGEGPLDGKEFGVSSITPMVVASSAGCPSDVQLPKGAYITYAPVCQYAEGLRPLVLASAWLTAGLIVFAMAKG